MGTKKDGKNEMSTSSYGFIIAALLLFLASGRKIHLSVFCFIPLGRLGLSRCVLAGGQRT